MNDSFVTFENKILEILKYLEICEDINFEDDLIMIFCSVIQHIDDFKDYHDKLRRLNYYKIKKHLMQ